VSPQTSTIVDPVISFTDLSTGTDFWNWNFGDLQTSVVQDPSSHTYATVGTYIITLIASTQYNCIDTAYQTIIIEPDFLFYIPNAFTPDGDGINDFFTGKGIYIEEFEMSIFDRWGNLIYRSDDITKPWDGKANKGTEIAQSDVYVYSIKVTDFKMGKHNYSGIVTLVR
jgi:gliding motility-associated-like protein